MPDEGMRRHVRTHLEAWRFAEAAALAEIRPETLRDSQRDLLTAAAAYGRRDSGALADLAADGLDPDTWAATCRLRHALDLAEHRWHRGGGEAAATLLVPALTELLPAAWAEGWVTDVFGETVPGANAAAFVRVRVGTDRLADPDHLAGLGLDADTDVDRPAALLAAVGAPAVRTGGRASPRGEIPVRGDGTPLPEARRAHMLWLGVREAMRGARSVLDRELLAVGPARAGELLTGCAERARAAVATMFDGLGDVAPAYDAAGGRWLETAMASMRHPDSVGPDRIERPTGTAAGAAHDAWARLPADPPDEESVEHLVEAGMTWARQVQTDVPPQLFGLYADLADRGLIGGATFGELVTILSTKAGEVGTESIEDDIAAVRAVLVDDAFLPAGGPDSPLRRLVGRLAPGAARESPLSRIRARLLDDLAADPEGPAPVSPAGPSSAG